MKIQNNQTGNTFLIGLLVLVLIGAGVLMYMRVSDSTGDTDTSQDHTNQEDDAVSTIINKQLTKMYSEPHLGVSFMAPENWNYTATDYSKDNQQPIYEDDASLLAEISINAPFQRTETNDGSGIAGMKISVLESGDRNLAMDFESKYGDAYMREEVSEFGQDNVPKFTPSRSNAFENKYIFYFVEIGNITYKVLGENIDTSSDAQNHFLLHDIIHQTLELSGALEA